MSAADERAEAAQDIRENGAPIVLTRTRTGYDATQARTINGEPETFNASAIDWEYKLSDIDGTLIQLGDLRLLVSAEEGMPDPGPGFTATYANVTYRVIDAKPVRIGGIPVVYDAQLRKA